MGLAQRLGRGLGQPLGLGRGLEWELRRELDQGLGPGLTLSCLGWPGPRTGGFPPRTFPLFPRAPQALWISLVPGGVCM